ncbi:MAG: phospho-N-acetylmuramoyl-pentapeptide-transferase [Robiginitomaculum sp.]
MLYHWLAGLSEDYQVFNLFNYISFRVGGAIMTSMLIAFIFGPKLINVLRSKQGKGQPIRTDGPESHIVAKAGTPTMGGLLILVSMVISCLLWGDLSNPYLWVVLLVTIGYGAIGFVDDYLKVSQQSPKGLNGKIKLVLEFIIAAVAVYVCMKTTASANVGFDTGLALPFVKDYTLNLGMFFIPFGCLVIVGASNAVNMTDGLDGLAIVPVMIAAASFCAIAYLVGHSVYSNYLGIPYVRGSAEIVIVLGALIGAGLGFLWYNAPPAMIFMGDTGSLALGGALGSAAVAVKHEIVLAIIGGLFVLEMVSVIVQVASFKLTGKRVFRMAPIHHHYEKKGWAEPTIVIRFWIIAVILAMIGLSTLKLR